MSRFLSQTHLNLTPYVPGEQPRDRQYLKLNTNESPFEVSASVLEAVSSEVGSLMLYSDPESTILREKMSEVYGIPSDMIVMGNGSDEIIALAFQAFCDSERSIAFPQVTYGFYPVAASLFGIPCRKIPLRDDFSINVDDFCKIESNIIFPNPNAPTGIAVSVSEIEKIVASNPENVVIVDEAYVEFGAQSCRNLVKKYQNLLVTGTFSKSHSLAGARLGFCFGSRELINDINTIRNSLNPYNINRMTQKAGIAALQDNDYYIQNCRKIAQNREFTSERLLQKGMRVLPSLANFIFASSPDVPGETLYRKLKNSGILVRHFSSENLTNWIRISIGTKEQMEKLTDAVSRIIDEERNEKSRY